MSLRQRLAALEAARATDAPEAAAVYTDEGVIVYIYATGERLSPEEFRRRWPNHPTLKAYVTWRLLRAV